MSDVVQIPFSAFKVIDLGQSVGLSAYQSLYKDHAEPIGLISVVQALGLLQPSDRAIEVFNEKWAKESVRWKLQETGIEVVTGKSSTTGEMAKTRDGEAALLVLSFLIEALGAKTAADLSRKIIDATPSNLLSIRPRRAQIANVVTAVESQTTCASWDQEITGSQDSVCERPVIWTSDIISPHVSFDLPLEAMQSFYHALCIISRFPTDYHCILKTPFSLTVAFALASSICGFRVCVVVDGEVVHGSPVSGQWQVRLERYLPKDFSVRKTEVKLGHKVEDAQDLLVVHEVGPPRANRIPLRGIASAATIGQGLSISEGEDLAILAIGAAISIVSRWQRELVDESGDADAEDVSLSESQSSTSSTEMNKTGQSDRMGMVPVKTRVTIDTIAAWWGCSTKKASDMLSQSEDAFSSQSKNASWMKVRFSRAIFGKIAEFEDLDADQKFAQRSRTNHALDQRDYGRLTHMLTTQLLLVAFLQGNTSTTDKVRVRATVSPQNSEIGRSIKALGKIEPLRQSDVLYSWYFWLHGKPPMIPDADYGIDVVNVEGYLIYRSLLLDLTLSPASCEMVAVEPGHICCSNQRLAEIRGPDNGYSVVQMPHYRAELQGRAKLRPQDRTGEMRLGWHVDEDDDSLDLTLWLRGRESGLQFSASVYQVAKLCWGLQYGDRSLGCTHDEDRVGALVEGERIEVVSAGCVQVSSSAWKPLLLLSANGNDLGQVACLLSAPENSVGMVRREACLRCCVTACNKRGLDFLID